MGGNRFVEELVEALYAVWVLACHLLVAVGAIAGLWIIEYLVHWLWPGTEPTVLGRVPLRAIIETADAGILIVFLGFGLYRVIMTMRIRP
jgi:hypothetical protein